MAKKIFNAGESEKFIHVVTEQVFVPTEEQRRIKAAFWYTYGQGPTVDPDQITAACIVDITKSSAVEKWWSDKAFKEWFRNKDEFRQRAEFQAQLAQDIIQDIMLNAAKASDRLNAAKLAIEIAGKIKRNQENIKLLDATIADMNEKQIDEFIAKRIGGVTDGKENNEGSDR